MEKTSPKKSKEDELFEAYVTAQSKYLDRLNNPEVKDPEFKARAIDLMTRVRSLLDDIEIESYEINSGYRDEETNKIVGGSARSAHRTGEAVDLKDTYGIMSGKITVDLLKKHDLYMENAQHTPGWCHLQTRAVRSGNRVFIP